MTATTPTVGTRIGDPAVSLRAERASRSRIPGRLVAALVRFAERGQLGPSDERELGRRTGART